MNSRNVAIIVFAACLIMISGVWAQEPEPTLLPTDTATVVPSDTPTNTTTPTSTATDSYTPTDTATNTVTALPTDTPTILPEVTAEVTSPVMFDELPPVTLEALEPPLMPMYLETLEPWCYAWDFAETHGNFYLHSFYGSGTWQYGEGWIGQPITLNGSNRMLLQISRGFTPTILRSISVSYERQQGTISNATPSLAEALSIFVNDVAV